MDQPDRFPAPRYLRTPDAALRLGLSTRTLEKYRCYGTGPAFHKLGGRVVYAIEALDACRPWLCGAVRRRGRDRATPVIALERQQEV